jgi:hypothetical protein
MFSSAFWRPIHRRLFPPVLGVKLHGSAIRERKNRHWHFERMSHLLSLSLYFFGPTPVRSEGEHVAPVFLDKTPGSRFLYDENVLKNIWQKSNISPLAQRH